jgi:two-component system sensor histidine kinase KdpD
VAIERAQLAEEAGQARLLHEAEKLQTALLNSISHDLRTPLASITGALSSLREDGALLDGDTRRSLIETAEEEAGRLNRLVGNLLNMTRLEAGVLRIHKEPCDLQDLVGTSLAQLGERLEGRQVAVHVRPGQALVPMDMVLILQVLANLFDNALKYSEPGTPVEVQATVAGAEGQISVADRGVGIPPEDIERVFDKFYRVQRPGAAGGTGLGLSICKGIVEGHGGRIWAEPRAGGGTIIRFTLPLGEPRSQASEVRP